MLPLTGLTGQPSRRGSVSSPHAVDDSGLGASSLSSESSLSSLKSFFLVSTVRLEVRDGLFFTLLVKKYLSVGAWWLLNAHHMGNNNIKRE